MITMFLAGISSQYAYSQNINKHIDNAENVSIDYLIPSDEYILSGNTFPTSIGGMSNIGAFGGPLSRIQLEKLDNNLNNQWFKTYATADEVNAVQTGVCSHLDVYFTTGDTKQTADQGYITCGRVRRDPETSGCPGAQYDNLFMLKTDASGNVQWYKRYDRFGMLVSVVEMPNGNFIACGYEGELGMTDVALIICTDPNGNILWSKHSLTPAFWDHTTILSSAYYEVIPFQGNYALVGIEDYAGTVWGGTLVTVIDGSGNYLQNAIVDNENYHYTLVGRALADAQDGDLVITGMGGNPCATGAQLMLLKIEPMSMNVKFHKVYSYNNLGDNSWGDAIKVIGSTIYFTGTDRTNGGAVYAEADFLGNLLRYSIFNAADAYDGKCMTVNTLLNIPVYSGTYFPSSEPTFVAKTTYGKECVTDIPMPEYDPPYDIYPAQDKDPGVKQIDDKVMEFDLVPVEKIVCGGTDVPTAAKKKYTTAISNTATAQFSITPNPASEFADISFKESFSGGKLEIVDITGHLVMSRELTADNISYRLDITSLLPGIYVVTVKQTDGMVHHSQLIKD